MHFSILLVNLIFLIKYQSTAAEKSYDVEIRSFKPNQNEHFNAGTLRVNRKGRNKYVMTGDFSLHTNLGEDSRMNYEISKKSEISNSYATVLKGGANICTFCSTNTNFYPRFRTFTNFPEPEICPFPKGNYTIKDYTVDDQILPPAVPTGTYILKTSFTKENENLFGYTMEFYVSRAN